MTTRRDRLVDAVRRKRAARSASAAALPRRPPEAPLRLGRMQRGLWILHRLDPSSPAYNLASAFRCDGPLDRERLQDALNVVVSRHRLLRTTFPAGRDDVEPVVHPDPALTVSVETAPAGQGQTVAERRSAEPFDLARGPLVRLTVIEEEQRDERLVVLSTHHIVADEASLALLWTELRIAYDGGDLGPSPARQFDDYAHWETEQAQETASDELDYWTRRLDPLPQPLVLPFERPAVGPRRSLGALEQRPVSTSLATKVEQLAGESGTTPFLVYAFAFRLLLDRYQEGRRVAFGTPVSTRSHPDARDMVGYFLNPVVVDVAIDESVPVIESLRRFGIETRDHLAHAGCPFDLLTERLGAPRGDGRHPLFQVMFVHQHLRETGLGSARLTPLLLDLGAAKHDLTLFASEAPQGSTIAVEYRTECYDRASMRSLLDHYHTLLEQLVEFPANRVAHASMLTTGETRRIEEFESGPPLTMTGAPPIWRRILEASRRTPRAEAVVCGDGRLDYEGLVARAWHVAEALLGAGVTPRDRVAIFVERSAALPAALLGVHLTGAAYVPLDPDYPAARQHDVLTDARPAVVLTTRAVASRLPEGDWTALTIDTLSEGPAPHLPLPDWTDRSALAYVLYTSGSTGRPKGVRVTHDNLWASTVARHQVYDTAPERFLLLSSVAFDSSVAGLFWTLASGGTLVLPTDADTRDARRLAELADRERVTTLLTVPSVYEQLLRLGAAHLTRLRTAIVAGEPCASALVREHRRLAPAARLYNEYGPTEATVWASVHEITAEDESRPVAIGRPIPGVEVRVLDADDRAVPVGVPGRLWIAGRTVSDGYWEREDETEACFAPDPRRPGRRRYLTGDRACWTPDGRLLFLGREDDQLGLRGFRVEPGEVEAALRTCPGVDDAGVTVRTDPPQLTAFLCPTEGPTLDLDAVRSALADRLPPFMVPDRLVPVAELPRLPNGKVDRRRLRDQPIETPTSSLADEPVTPQEAQLVALWQGLLGRTDVGATDNFFELGGHSLLVVDMVDAVARDHGVSIAPAEVFQAPTIRQLARRLDRESGAGTATTYRHLFPIQPGGHGTPLVVAIPHVFSGRLAERFRGERPVYGLRGVGIRPEGNAGRWRTMTALGEELADEILDRFPDPPYLLAGYSFGATMAFETARRLEARGVAVRGLLLIAPMALDRYALGPLRIQVDRLREPLTELSTPDVLRRIGRDLDPRTRGPYTRARQLLTVRPWRRLLAVTGQVRRGLGLPLTPRIIDADVRAERFRLHRRYRPGPLQTPTVIFNPTETATDAAATWRPWFHGPLRVIATPDPHRGEPERDAAWAIMSERLRDVDGGWEAGD